jgi:hypothetical protein
MFFRVVVAADVRTALWLSLEMAMLSSLLICILVTHNRFASAARFVLLVLWHPIPEQPRAGRVRMGHMLLELAMKSASTVLRAHSRQRVVPPHVKSVRLVLRSL